MKNIPTQLYSREITDFIRDQILEFNVKNFDEMYEIHKETLLSLSLESLNYDVEIVLSQDTNEVLSKYLYSYDPDYLIEFKRLSKQDYFDHFSYYFDLLIKEIIDDIKSEDLIEAGFMANKDLSNGEIYWRKSA